MPFIKQLQRRNWIQNVYKVNNVLLSSRIRYTNWVFFSIKLNTSSNICIKSTCIKAKRNIGGVNNYMWIWKVRSGWMKGYNRNQCWSWPHYPQLGRPETPMWGNYGTIHQVFRGGRGRAGLRSGQVLRSRLALQLELETYLHEQSPPIKTVC